VFQLLIYTFQERLIGFQILAPHAADIATGFAMAMKLNATRTDFQNMAGVNPSAAEVPNSIF
jgi:pyruvate/2-oxoglutarate dehydrogenase complex dihydrolipoamide dehydrogenase (E3) component